MTEFQEHEVSKEFDHVPSVLELSCPVEQVSGLPQRHLTKWYLKRESSSSHSFKICSLPSDQKFTKGRYKLYGNLVPSSPSSSNTNLKNRPPSITLSNPLQWHINLSSPLRGIWVQTSSAWYYLKGPSTTTKSSSSSSKPQIPQSTIHAPLRAKLALLSNLIDVLRDKKSAFIIVHARRTPEKIYSLLIPSSECLDSRPPDQPLNDKPFDLDLLEHGDGNAAVFVRKHLKNLNKALNNECAFVKGLEAIIHAKKVEHGMEWGEERYVKSAMESERRGACRPWGEKIPGVVVRPNLCLELEIERVDKNASVLGGDGASDVEDDTPVGVARSANRKRSRLVIDDESDNDDEKSAPSVARINSRNQGEKEKKRLKCRNQKRILPNRTNIEKEIMGADLENSVELVSQPLPHDNHYLSAQSMSTSIQTISRFLEPKPTEQDILSVDYKKYLIPDTCMHSFLEEVITKSIVLNLEMMLLTVEAIARSGPKSLKAMFRSKKESIVNGQQPLLGGYVVFKKWLCFVLQRLEARLQDGFDDDDCSEEPNTIEELIACSILNLICEFHVIKDLKQIGILKSKFQVDWFTIVEKSMEFASTYRLSGLIRSSKKASDHLNSIKNTSNGSSGNTVTPSSVRINSNASSDKKSTKTWTPPKSTAFGKKGAPSKNLPLSVASDLPKDSINHKGKHLKSWSTSQTEQSNITSSGSAIRKWTPPQNTNTITPSLITTSSSGKELTRQHRMARIFEDAKRKHDPTSQKQQHEQQNSTYDQKSQQEQKKNDANGSKVSSFDTSVNTWQGGWGKVPQSSTAGGSGGSSAWGQKSSEGGWGSSSAKTSTAWGAGTNMTDSGSGNGGWGSGTGASGWCNNDSSNAGWSSNVKGTGITLSVDTDHRSSQPPSSSKVVQNRISTSNIHRNNICEGECSINEKKRNDRINGPAENLSEDGEINDLHSQMMHHKPNQDDNAADSRYRNLNENSAYPIKKSRYENTYNNSSSQDKDIKHGLSRSSSESMGRGRGRDKTIPAWLSRQERNVPNGNEARIARIEEEKASLRDSRQNLNTVGNSSGPTTESINGGGRGRERTTLAWKSQTQPKTLNNNEEDGGKKLWDESRQVRSDASRRGVMGGGSGRGRERTIPSWMTDKPNNVCSDREQDKIIAENMRHVEVDAPNGTARGSHSKNSDFGSTQLSGNTDSSSGRIPIGRGRGRTTPAWITKQSNDTEYIRNLDSKSENKYYSEGGEVRNNIHSNKMAGGNPVGRGRGMTTPAWVTKSSSSTDCGFSQDKQRNASFEKTSHQDIGNLPQGIQGVGRGRDRTKPAWMTQKSGNTDYASADKHWNSSETRQLDRSGHDKSSSERTDQKLSNVNNNTGDGWDSSKPSDRITDVSRDGNRAIRAGVTGFGRGRGATTPAWMTKKSANDTDERSDNTHNMSQNWGDVSNSRQRSMEASRVGSNIGRDADHVNPIKRRSDDYTSDRRSGSLGRGRNQTLPAWLTKESGLSSSSKGASESNTHDGSVFQNHDSKEHADTCTGSSLRPNSVQRSISSYSDSLSNGNTIQNRSNGYDDGARGYKDQRSHGNFRHQRGIGDDRYESQSSASRPRSLGRGKDINLPAWMSKK